MIALWLAAVYAMTIAAPPAQVAEQETTRIVNAFVTACMERADLSERQKAQIKTDAAQFGDREAAQVFITSTLGQLFPPFQAALTALGDEQTAPAIAALNTLAKTADPFLSAHSAYFLARSHILNEDFEKALPILKRSSDQIEGHTLYAGESMFLRGVSEAHTLQRDLAAETLSTFVHQYPDAPERLIIGATHLVMELESIKDGSLPDVRDRMTLCRRRLKLKDSSSTTQVQQDQIVSLLDTLIEQAEQREKQASSSSSGQAGASGNAASDKPADDSFAPVGEAPEGSLRRVRRINPADTWGQLPPREREKVRNLLKENFPDRYRKLVEQYFRSFQAEDDGGK